MTADTNHTSKSSWESLMIFKDPKVLKTKKLEALSSAPPTLTGSYWWGVGGVLPWGASTLYKPGPAAALVSEFLGWALPNTTLSLSVVAWLGATSREKSKGTTNKRELWTGRGNVESDEVEPPKPMLGWLHCMLPPLPPVRGEEETFFWRQEANGRKGTYLSRVACLSFKHWPCLCTAHLDCSSSRGH